MAQAIRSCGVGLRGWWRRVVRRARGVGCRLRFEGTDGKITRVRGVETAAANLGGLCAKGAQLGPTIDTPDRLKYPLHRNRFGDFEPTDWNSALNRIAEVVANVIRTHGPDGLKAVAENAVLNANYLMSRVKHFLPVPHGERSYALPGHNTKLRLWTPSSGDGPNSSM